MATRSEAVGRGAPKKGVSKADPRRREPTGVRLTTSELKFTPPRKVLPAPRHHHTSTIRSCLPSADLSETDSKASQAPWDYFPSGTEYGPEYIEDAEQLLIQWGTTFVNTPTTTSSIMRLKNAVSFREGCVTSTSMPTAKVHHVHDFPSARSGRVSDAPCDSVPPLRQMV